MARMSTKNLTIAGATAAAFALLRRSRRTDRAVTMHDLGSPGGVNEPGSIAGDGSGAGHAPGHRHLAPPPKSRTARLAHRADRSWAGARRRSSGRTP